MIKISAHLQNTNIVCKHEVNVTKKSVFYFIIIYLYYFVLLFDSVKRDNHIKSGRRTLTMS